MVPLSRLAGGTTFTLASGRPTPCHQDRLCDPGAPATRGWWLLLSSPFVAWGFVRAMASARVRRKCRLAWVVMPEHIHMIVLPPPSRAPRSIGFWKSGNRWGCSEALVHNSFLICSNSRIQNGYRRITSSLTLIYTIMRVVDSRIFLAAASSSSSVIARRHVSNDTP